MSCVCELGLRFSLQNSRFSVLQPLIKLAGKREDGPFATASRAMHRQTKLRLPALRGAHAGMQVGGNIFPGIENRFSHAGLPTEIFGHDQMQADSCWFLNLRLG